jgi:hypothetical protein
MRQDALIGAASDEPANWIRPGSLLLALALFITIINAAKPLTSDDAVYFQFAEHIASHPLDPFGFRVWGEYDANRCLAPPVFLYWWALGLRILGDEPVLWKLWLLPINSLFVFALYKLGRRACRPMVWPFVGFVSLSPAVLPCFNLMLDIPALTLGLTAILLFLHACDSDSTVTCLAAGLVGAVAAQTKYTAFVVPGVMLLYGWLFGKWRQGITAAALVVLLFVGWEALIAWRYGDSHFLLAAGEVRAPALAKLKLVGPLFGYLGSTAALAIPLGLAALGYRRSSVVSLATIGLGMAGLLFLPTAASSTGLSSLQHFDWRWWYGLQFGVFGLAFFASLSAIGWRLYSQAVTVNRSLVCGRLVSIDGFLILWLALELVAYFGLSPYPGARRILGIFVVAMLLVFRLSAFTCRQNMAGVWALVGTNLCLGLLFFAADSSFSRGESDLAHAVANERQRISPQATVWYIAFSAFDFPASRLGMKRLVAPHTEVGTGDWVVVVDRDEDYFSQFSAAACCRPSFRFDWTPTLPLKSQYQSGAVALTPLLGPLHRATVYVAQ